MLSLKFGIIAVHILQKVVYLLVGFVCLLRREVIIKVRIGLVLGINLFELGETVLFKIWEPTILLETLVGKSELASVFLCVDPRVVAFVYIELFACFGLTYVWSTCRWWSWLRLLVVKCTSKTVKLICREISVCVCHI